MWKNIYRNESTKKNIKTHHLTTRMKVAMTLIMLLILALITVAAVVVVRFRGNSSIETTTTLSIFTPTKPKSTTPFIFGNNTLSPNQSLPVYGIISSPKSCITFNVGTFILVPNALYVQRQIANQMLWQSPFKTSNPQNITLRMQADGDLVVYDSHVNASVWSTGTAGHPGAYLSVQDDGNVVVYYAPDGAYPGRAIWSTGSNFTGWGC